MTDASGTATALRCKGCGTPRPLAALYACEECFGPLEVAYDGDRLRRVTRARIAAGPPSMWRYRDLLPAGPADPARLPVGLTPLVPPPRLAERLGSEMCGSERRREPHAQLQGPRRRGGAREGARARVRRRGVRLDGNLANAVTPRRSASRECRSASGALPESAPVWELRHFLFPQRPPVSVR